MQKEMWDFETFHAERGIYCNEIRHHSVKYVILCHRWLQCVLNHYECDTKCTESLRRPHLFKDSTPQFDYTLMNIAQLNWH